MLIQQFQQMVLDWMWLPMVFGVVGMNAPSLTYGFSTPTPLPMVVRSPNAIENMRIKKRAYDQRVREIEQGTFTPLVLSSAGGMDAAARVFYKRLASMMAAKTDQAYSKTLTWVRCTLSFALLSTSIQCIRGARSSIGWAARENFPPIDLVTSEASISSH